MLLLFLFCCVLTAAVFASDATVTKAPAGPPLAPQKPVTDLVQGKKITDPYRWLEDASSADTKEWVNAELAYTRDILDPLPGREQLHKRLSELLSPKIGRAHV